jgi:hypothetical protein
VPPAEREIWYGSVRVGRVRDAFFTDATWYGVFETTLRPDDGGLPARLDDYIRFCIDWNRRTRDNADPPDADEFDRYADVLETGRWFTRTPEGATRPIDIAPVFFEEGDEVTWRMPDEQP